MQSSSCADKPLLVKPDEINQQRQSVSITSRRQVNIGSTHGRSAEHIAFERLALDE
jgi:hypothetical protein